MIVAVFPLVVAIIGGVVYGFSSNAKVAEIGRLLFFIGMLWLVYASIGRVVKF